MDHWKEGGGSHGPKRVITPDWGDSRLQRKLCKLPKLYSVFLTLVERIHLWALMSICPHKAPFEKRSLKMRKCQRVFVSDVCSYRAAKGLRHAEKNPAELFEKKASITNSIFFWCLDAEKKQMSGCPLPREVMAKTLRLLYFVWVCVCWGSNQR